MRALIEYLDDNVSMRLNKIEFTRIDIVNDDSVEFYIDDNFIISSVEEKVFAILLKRRIYCIPESLLDVKVEFEIARYISEEYDVSLDEFNLDEELSEENIDDYIDGNMCRASALISSITSNFGMTPLVTPPIFIKKEK